MTLIIFVLYKTPSAEMSQDSQKIQKIDSNNSPPSLRKNVDKLNRQSKNFLMVNNHNSSEQYIEEHENSIDRMTDKRLNDKKYVEEYVELPKINFMKDSSAKDRKNSQVIMDIKLIEQPIDKPYADTYISRVSDEEASEILLEDDKQYASWNIQKINIIPAKDNFIEEENLQNYTIPTYPQNQKRRAAKEKQKEQQRKLYKERERRERQRNIEIVSEFLSGKASVIWLFILSDGVSEKELKDIQNVYKQYIQNDYQVPVCKGYNDALRFLNIQSCFFKVVVDIEISDSLLDNSATHKNIVAIYLYNPIKQRGINRGFQLKKTTKKIKGMFMDLEEAAHQAHEEIQNQAKFIRVGNELQRQHNKLRFPSFIVLSGFDSSEVTAYRFCLYGALKLKERKDRQKYLEQFTEMVQVRYADVPKQLANLQQYKKIDHLSENTESKLREILKFYVRQTFYYGLTNSILRISRSSQQFRPCTIPFNQTYHAIKHFYLKSWEQSKGKPKKLITYRGAKLRSSDLKSLEIGSYIELLGFTSTSLKRSEAEKFMDNDSFLFEIQVQTFGQNTKELEYDHGFVEINKYGFAAHAFQNQEQILFNALNIFKVIELDLESAIRKITLKYGAILDLLRARPEKLTPKEKAVISNYQYCTKTFETVEDSGDILLLAQQHDKCIEFYQNKIDEGEKSYKIFGKLANVQLECGDLDEAYNNALKSLELLNKEPVKQVHKQSNKYKNNSEVFHMKEDFLHFRASIEKHLQILGDDWFAQAKLLKQRGQTEFKSGNLKNAELDLLKSKQILKTKEQSFDKRRKQVNKRFMIRSFCCMCSRSATSQLQEQKQLELLDIQSQQVNFQNRKDQFQELSLEIQNLLKQYAVHIGNKKLEEESSKLARQHYERISKVNQVENPLISAKFCAMEASLLTTTNQDLNKFQDLMETAISHAKKQHQFHQSLGVYSKLLGVQRHNNMKRRLMLQPINSQKPNLSVVEKKKKVSNTYNRMEDFQSRTLSEDLVYDYGEQSRLHDKSKEAYSDAANVIAYHKGKEHPEYLEMRNGVAELDFDVCNLKDSQKNVEQSKRYKSAHSHSEGARCYHLMAKISLAKGELKRAFESIEQSLQILRSSLVKVDNKEYNKIFMNHPYYTEIVLSKVKIFNRQLKHDLALKELQIIKKIAKRSGDASHSKHNLATIYQEQAEIMICMGETEEFESYISRAIEIRQQEMGKYNIPNAICYSNLFKYLRYLNDYDEALSYHIKATEIFSRFPSDHPNAWIINLSNGLTFLENKEVEQAMNQIQYCIKVAAKRYTKTHINLLKVQFQYAKLLQSNQEDDKALRIYSQLQNKVSSCLKQSMKIQKIDKQIDDEKILLIRNIYQSIKQIHEKIQQANKSNSEIKRCEEKLREIDYLAVTTSKIRNTNI